MSEAKVVLLNEIEPGYHSTMLKLPLHQAGGPRVVESSFHLGPLRGRAARATAGV